MANKKYKKIGIYDESLNPLIYDKISKNTICLDVGCWIGNLGKKLIKEKGCIVDGIDVNKKALAEAKRRGYRDVFLINLITDINKLNTITRKYDYIICADLLEHLANPAEVLTILGKKLRKNGNIIISVPNVVFIKNRLDIFTGKFDYNPNGGIMDETHLRFFTQKTIKELCKKSGFKIVHFQGYSLVKNRFFYLRFFAKIWPSLFSIQFLVLLEKKIK